MKLPRTTIGKYKVEAVAKALDVLEVFSGSEELALNEICRRVGLSKSRTFRLLHTLAERGYIDRCADGSRYRLGAKLFERASNLRRDLKQLAQPFMRRLHERFNETVNLGVLSDEEVLYIDILETSRPFRMTATVGCRMPASLTAMGKAMLARLPRENPGAPDARPASGLHRSQRRMLKQELARVRRRGYAVDNEQNERGVACIGAAILDAAGRPVAALSVSGPAYRILAEKKNLAPGVVAACRGISQSLGFSAGAGMAKPKSLGSLG
ncbi:MAG: IclR family transcriptional regulator [Acidobacteriia bacterium]|nr:IclR family transcriptional regulator [Terriglobia bacterium]